MIHIQLAVDSGMLVLIWLVQLIIYPSFRFADQSVFVDWHTRYTGLISCFVVPLMLCQVGLELYFLFTAELRLFRLAVLCLVWLATFGLSVPCHNRLNRKGWNPEVIDRLILTNWLRTLCWTLLFISTLQSVFVF